VRCKGLKKRLKIIHFLPKSYLYRLGILVTILLSATTLVFSFLIRDLINHVVNGNNNFYHILYLFLGMLVLQLVFLFLKHLLLGVYTEKGSAFLRKRMLEVIVQTEAFKNQTLDPTDYLSNVETDLNQVKTFMAKTMPEVIHSFLQILGAIVLLFIFNWKLMLIFILIFVLMRWAIKLISNKKIQSRDLNTIISQCFEGEARDVDYFINLHHDEVELNYQNKLKAERKQALLVLFSYLQSILPYVVSMMLGGYFVLDEQFTIGGLVAILYLLHHLRFRELPNLATKGIGQIAAISRIMQNFEPKEMEEEFIE
jgi:ABC-type multidrug transport system fused ATPase/permease subunit